MSYILDALRRADAERERGTVPSLHTQQFGVLPGDDEAPPRSRLLIGTIALLVLALGGMLAWNFFGGSEPPPRPVAQAVAPPPGVAPPPVFAPQSLASASAGLPASAATATAMATSPPRPLPRPAARREVAPATPPSSPTAPASDRIYSLAELPEAIRRELPKLAYGGGSYSGDKASRLAFLNGQVFHEGDTIAPGLVLKQVKQKGVILAYKGYRFEIGP
jgi:general secretion pathway protein B